MNLEALKLKIVCFFVVYLQTMPIINLFVIKNDFFGENIFFINYYEKYTSQGRRFVDKGKVYRI